MNCYVYGYGPAGKERTDRRGPSASPFPTWTASRASDVILPDIAWLHERRDRIDGIFITHRARGSRGRGGAISGGQFARAGPLPPASPRSTPCASWRRRATASNRVHVAPVWPEAVKAGPFTVQFAPVSHSIPEASALVIDTPEGRVVHSGDFKIDRNPVVGEPFDPRVVGPDRRRRGCWPYICDSTNVFNRHAGRSEKPTARTDRRIDRRRQGHGRGDHLRLEHRAAADAGRCGAGQWPLGLPDGARDEAPWSRRARNRAF